MNKDSETHNKVIISIRWIYEKENYKFIRSNPSAYDDDYHDFYGTLQKYK